MDIIKGALYWKEAAKGGMGIDMKIREIMETLQLNKILDKGDRKYNQLMTPWGEQIAQEQTEVVLTEYPRPQMARKNHIILNVIWKYAFT